MLGLIQVFIPHESHCMLQLRKRNLAELVTIAMLLSGCASQTTGSSSGIVPQTASKGTNPGNVSTSTPPASSLRLGTPTLSRIGSGRATKSVSFVDCPSPALCILQGQSGIYTNYWYPLDGISKPNLLITTQFSPIQGVIYVIDPNPVHLTPATFTVSINVSSNASIGIQNVIISGTNSDGSTNPTYPYSFYICSAITGSCVGPAPTPSPTPTMAPPPPPISGKGAFTADRTAHVIIPLTDPDTSSETLTWSVSGFPTTFTKVGFSSQTTSSPHKTSLIFDVGVDTIPKNYPLSMTVRSVATGLASSVSTVNISVPHIVEYYTLVNSSNLYETNAEKQVVVSDDSQYVSNGPIVVADFPGIGSGVATASIMRPRQSISSGLPSWFDINGPNAKCLGKGSLIGDQDGKTPAQIDVTVTCVKASVSSVDLTTKSSVVNNYDALLPDLPKQTLPCSVKIGIFFSCSTGAVTLQHYTNQATAVVLSMHMNMNNVDAGDLALENERLYLTLNAKGVPYPEISFVGGNNTIVPFPTITRPLANCPSNSRGTDICPNSVPKTFRENAINYYATQGWKVPAGISINASGLIYQTHHILPLGCGGGDSKGNGVFLTVVQHNPFTQWWRFVPPCAPMGPSN